MRSTVAKKIQDQIQYELNRDFHPEQFPDIAGNPRRQIYSRRFLRFRDRTSLEEKLALRRARGRGCKPG